MAKPFYFVQENPTFGVNRNMSNLIKVINQIYIVKILFSNLPFQIRFITNNTKFVENLKKRTSCSQLVYSAIRSKLKEKLGYFFELTLVGNLALVHLTRPDLSQSVCLNMHLLHTSTGINRK